LADRLKSFANYVRGIEPDEVLAVIKSASQRAEIRQQALAIIEALGPIAEVCSPLRPTLVH
jgi:hypothetical protein